MSRDFDYIDWFSEWDERLGTTWPACRLCGAVVLNSNTTTHVTWHRSMGQGQFIDGAES